MADQPQDNSGQVTKRWLPEIKPLDKNHPENSTFVTPYGKVFSFAELSAIFAKNGNLDQLAREFGMSRTDIRSWKQQIENVIKGRVERKVIRAKKTETIFESTMRKLEETRDTISSAPGKSGFFSRKSSYLRDIKTDTQAVQDLQSTNPDAQTTPALLKKIQAILERTEKHQEAILEMQKDNLRVIEENRQEGQRHPGPSPKLEEHGGGESRFAEILKNMWGLGMSALFAPQNIVPLLEEMGLFAIFTKLLTPKIIGLVGAIAMTIGDAITGYLKADEWKVTKLSAAIGGALGGTGPGGELWNSLAKAGEFALIGMQVGGLAAGPVGMLAGAVIGAAVGGILGWIGPEKVSQAIDGTIRSLQRWSDIVLGTHFALDKTTLDEQMKTTQSIMDGLDTKIKQSQADIANVDLQLKAAILAGDAAAVKSLQDQKNKFVTELDNAQIESDKQTQILKDAKRNLIQTGLEGWGNFWTRNWNENIWKREDYDAEVAKMKKTGSWWSDSQSERLNIFDKIGISYTSSMTRLLEYIEGATKQALDDSITQFNMDTAWVGEGFQGLVDTIKSWWTGLIDQMKGIFDPKNWQNFLFGDGKAAFGDAQAPGKPVSGWSNTPAATPDVAPKTVLPPGLNDLIPQDGISAPETTSDVFKRMKPSTVSTLGKIYDGIYPDQNSQTAAITPSLWTQDTIKKMKLSAEAKQQSSAIQNAQAKSAMGNLMVPVVKNSTDNRRVSTIHNNSYFGGMNTVDKSFMGQ